MPTMAEAIHEYMQTVQGPVTVNDVKHAVEQQYPNQWKPATFDGHLYGCVVNNPKAYLHHPSFRKFLYKYSDGRFELYSEEKHGPNVWAPREGEDDVEGTAELAEASISLERDLEDHLVNNLESIEPGLKLVQRQYNTDVGRVDILAEDRNGASVVIEVKAGEAKDSVIGQIARYLGWLARRDGKTPRGIVIASHFPEGVKYAATMVGGLRLLAYRVQFSFDEAQV